MLIVPGDPLNPRRPDPHFAAEWQAARALCLPTGLIDHDAAEQGRAEEAVRRLGRADAAVYRGWMLSADAYAQVWRAAADRGCVLATDPQAYRAAHELPGWVDLIGGLGAQTVWAAGGVQALDGLARQIGTGPVVLRDFVKSAKHAWSEAVFVLDVADTSALRRVADRFLEFRGASFTGGFVIRRFEPYPDAEVRTRWVDGRCRLVSPHPDTPDLLPEQFSVPDGLPGVVAAHPNRFVTVDLARHADGRWRVIELGDGQVSDRPASVDAATLLAALGWS